MARKKEAPTRGYGLTAWSRAVLAVVDRPDDTRRVGKARAYFRERKILDVRLRPGVVTALVQGSQVEPFETSLTMRTVEADTVVAPNSHRWPTATATPCSTSAAWSPPTCRSPS